MQRPCPPPRGRRHHRRRRRRPRRSSFGRGVASRIRCDKRVNCGRLASVPPQQQQLARARLRARAHLRAMLLLLLLLSRVGAIPRPCRLPRPFGQSLGLSRLAQRRHRHAYLAFRPIRSSSKSSNSDAELRRRTRLPEPTVAETATAVMRDYRRKRSTRARMTLIGSSRLGSACSRHLLRTTPRRCPSTCCTTRPRCRPSAQGSTTSSRSEVSISYSEFFVFLLRSFLDTQASKSHGCFLLFSANGVMLASTVLESSGDRLPVQKRGQQQEQQQQQQRRRGVLAAATDAATAAAAASAGESRASGGDGEEDDEDEEDDDEDDGASRARGGGGGGGVGLRTVRFPPSSSSSSASSSSSSSSSFFSSYPAAAAEASSGAAASTAAASAPVHVCSVSCSRDLQIAALSNGACLHVHACVCRY